MAPPSRVMALWSVSSANSQGQHNVLPEWGPIASSFWVICTDAGENLEADAEWWGSLAIAELPQSLLSRQCRVARVCKQNLLFISSPWSPITRPFPLWVTQAQVHAVGTMWGEAGRKDGSPISPLPLLVYYQKWLWPIMEFWRIENRKHKEQSE